MKCRLIAAGTRLPEWVDEGFREYQKRLRTPLVLGAHRDTDASAARAKIRSAPSPAKAKACSPRWDGRTMSWPSKYQAKSMTTEQLSAWLAERLRDARPLALLIGGPDGLSDGCRARANQSWSLSPLTLPHALVRIVLAEQIYRAMSLLAGHPYHRA